MISQKQTESLSGTDHPYHPSSSVQSLTSAASSLSPTFARPVVTLNGSASSVEAQSNRSQSSLPLTNHLQDRANGVHASHSSKTAGHVPTDQNVRSPNSVPSRSTSVRSISETPAIAAIPAKPLIFAAMASVEESPPSRQQAPWATNLSPSPSLLNHAMVNISPSGFPSSPLDGPSRQPVVSPQYKEKSSPAASHSFSPARRHVGSIDVSSPTSMPTSPRFAPEPASQRPSTPSNSFRKPSKTGLFSPIPESPSISVGPMDSLSAPSDIPSRNGPRTLAKVRPTTPVDSRKGKIPQDLEYGSLRRPGIPLDDDPFAKVEGVRMLKPGTSKDLVNPTSRDGISKKRDGHAKPHKGKHGSTEHLRSLSPNVTKGQGHSTDMDTATMLGLALQHGQISLEEQTASEAYRRAEKAPRTRSHVFAQLVDCLHVSTVLSCLLSYLSFYDWCVLFCVSKHISTSLCASKDLKEEVLERFLATVGYTRWISSEPEPLPLSLMVCLFRAVFLPTSS